LIALEADHDLEILLQNVVSKIREGEVEEALNLLSKARNSIIERIPSGTSSSVSGVLYQISCLAYLAMLHYLFMAQLKTENMDDIKKLTYLSESVGINNVLECVLFPLLSIGDSRARDKLFRTIRSAELYKDESYKEIRRLINDFRSNRNDQSGELDKSIKTVIELVDPGYSEVRTLALQLGRRFEAGDFKQARRIYEYVRDEIHYMPDPLLFEDIQSPRVTLKRSSGDCDDKAILLCSLLLAIGFETALLFADTDGDRVPDHVYSAVNIPTAPDIYKPFASKRIGGKDLHDWIPLDPTSEDLDFGVITLNDLEIKYAYFFCKNKQYLLSD